MANNVIPRNFKMIVGKMKINTGTCQIGDFLRIKKDDHCTGYLATNTRTNKNCYVFASMIRNPELFEVLKII